MLKTFPKALGLVLLTTALSSCGLFSSNKELPTGTRRPITTIDQEEDLFAQKPLGGYQVPQAVNTKNWEQTGMSATHQGFNFAARKNLQKVWKKSFGDGADKRNALLTAPVVYHDKVFVQDARGYVTAFQLNNGEKLWTSKLKSELSSENDASLNGIGLAAHNGKILAATGFGTLFALDENTGEILWKYNAKTPLRSAPTVCANRAYLRTLDNMLIAVSLEDGTLSWRYNISAEDTVWAGAAVPACSAEKNMLVAGFSNGDIQAFNAGIGYPLWTASLLDSSSTPFSSDINAIQAPAVIDENMVYASGAEVTTSIDPRTGESKWIKKIGSLNMPLVVGNYVFLITATHQIAAVEKDTGVLVWLKNIPQDEDTPVEEIYYTGPLMVNANLLVASSEGNVYAFSAQDGELLYQIELDDGVAASPIIANGYVIFITNDADIVVYQ